MPRRLFILGSTGSIGRSTIKVIEHLQKLDCADNWNVVGLAAGRNSSLLRQQIAALDVDAASMEHSDGSIDVKHFYEGSTGAVELIREHAKKGDLVIAAIVGFAGIAPTLAAIECGCDIALANKESLVAGGKLVMDAVKKHGVRLLPVDSEHSAIFQSIAGSHKREIAKVILTASGGSLRDLSSEEMATATLEQVLKHPTWKMGAKVTIDSASLMNKALELVEAHWLFDVKSHQLDAVVHPQSIVHGFVQFRDGSVIAQLSSPDMRLPIQYALTWPDRFEGSSNAIDWSSIGSLDFNAVDPTLYPAIGLAHEVIKRGGTSGTIFNAANEIVVTAFLDQKLQFGSMVGIVEEVLDQITIVDQVDMATVIAADKEARSLATELVGTGILH